MFIAYFLHKELWHSDNSVGQGTTAEFVFATPLFLKVYGTVDSSSEILWCFRFIPTIQTFIHRRL
jgi:hypothetical protein